MLRRDLSLVTNRYVENLGRREGVELEVGCCVLIDLNAVDLVKPWVKRDGDRR